MPTLFLPLLVALGGCSESELLAAVAPASPAAATSAPPLTGLQPGDDAPVVDDVIAGAAAGSAQSAFAFDATWQPSNFGGTSFEVGSVHGLDNLFTMSVTSKYDRNAGFAIAAVEKDGVIRGQLQRPRLVSKNPVVYRADAFPFVLKMAEWNSKESTKTPLVLDGHSVTFDAVSGTPTSCTLTISHPDKGRATVKGGIGSGGYVLSSQQTAPSGTTPYRDVFCSSWKTDPMTATLHPQAAKAPPPLWLLRVAVAGLFVQLQASY
jgi:hypothetical protein